ncbi:Alcohol dehydrogenase, zinc-binding protein [Candidatus Koribacter versatilis Ellin345]|uniref:Alcohol dehydrogenase, zinc-binding protein n=1 Tax=Koribacter versatilis (strain Ellin345) TaxID=204669 RepID=Q1IK06_KORVE|nr:bi-domain-containing oxidoreductase [Candidatus Koribacter versatilis]ABF42794.1 Alcohol dehydrogenase, zinc-binding protein [Candidatus Koribacter versatilis Ellin345]
MKQVIQYQKTGDITVEELPVPQLKSGGILVRNFFSLISAGTERSSVTTAQASLIGKAQARPDLVRQVMDNVKREGLMATIEKVQNRLDNYKELGYSCAGIVVESAVDEFKVGDRVACGGVGYASHSEIVYVPKNLATLVPESVAMDDAAYTTVIAIAMQGVRQADVRVGEKVVVMGLGLIGLITVQILKASGCAVIGLDISDRNFELAKKFGCSECAVSDMHSVGKVEAFTRGRGSDAVIVTAATKSSEPVELAMQYARKRSKVVVVGAVGMDIPRSPFYEKEVDFRISCSYGPGRYDSEYEERGHDYPIGYVRWTEKRNMESALDLIAERRLDVRSLTTHTIPVDKALEAYDIITGKTQTPYLGILLSYPDATYERTAANRRIDLSPTKAVPESSAAIAFIGAGNFAQSYLLPPLKKIGAQFELVATSKPVNASSVAKKFGFRSFTTDPGEVFQDPAVKLVFISTRHDTHGRYVLEALQAGKRVFVEKPLAISSKELEEIGATYRAAAESGNSPFLMVGYNRRFSDPLKTMKKFFQGAGEPLTMHYRVNAGYLPLNSWYQDSAQGGRTVGEMCHFVDTMQFLAGAQPVSVYASAPADKAGRYNHDNAVVQITFDDGSVGSILYLASGGPSMPKEYIEAFAGGRSAVMDSFKSLVMYSGRKDEKKSYSGDKGHTAEMQAVMDGLKNGQSPIPFGSLEATSKVTFAALESIRTRSRVDIE